MIYISKFDAHFFQLELVRYYRKYNKEYHKLLLHTDYEYTDILLAGIKVEDDFFQFYECR